MSKKPVKIRIFKNAWFQRFAEKEGITDALLKTAVSEIERGLIGADLGGNVFKQRIPKKGQGKSGGYRAILFFKKGEKSFFVYGYAKSKRDNIDAKELKAFKDAAIEVLKLSDEQIELLLKAHDFTEVL